MRTHTDLLVRTYIYIDVHIYVYVYIYISLSLCVCEDVASPRDQSSIIQATVPPADATSQKWQERV